MTDSPEPKPAPPDTENEEEASAAVKPFLEHLEDLRWMLIKMLATLGVATLACFVFAAQLLTVLIYPLQRATGDAEPFLRTLEVTGGFSVALKLALYAGIVICCPALLYFLAQFVLPALTSQEKRMLAPVLGFGVGLFLVGVAMAYLVVIPNALRFFIHYNRSLHIRSEWTIQNYVSFVTVISLAFGLAFELPLVIVALARLGLVTHKFLRQKRIYAIPLIFFIAAVITPPDLMSQILLGVPMCLLYEACIWLAWSMERRKRPESEVSSQ
jgi:sec-independent protein translocase protein TatC